MTGMGVCNYPATCSGDEKLHGTVYQHAAGLGFSRPGRVVNSFSAEKMAGGTTHILECRVGSSPASAAGRAKERESQEDRFIAHFPTGSTKFGPTEKLWLHSTTFLRFPSWGRAGKLGDSSRRFPLLSEVPARSESANWVQLGPPQRVNRVQTGSTVQEPCV
eukprot:364270-Chlamydomonas_euryale.AAC.7